MKVGDIVKVFGNPYYRGAEGKIYQMYSDGIILINLTKEYDGFIIGSRLGFYKNEVILLTKPRSVIKWL